MGKRILIGMTGLLVAVVVLLGLSLFFIDEPLRRYIESNLNNNLKGYTVKLEAVDFHPIGFSIDFKNLTLSQEANPDPPLLFIPSWTASIQWTELLKMEIVSDHVIERAEMVLQYAQVKKEAKDKTEVEEKGWQEAVYAVYPITINTFKIEDSSFSFRDKPDHPPLQLTHLHVSVENIQNIRSQEGEYPSVIDVEGTIHDSGMVKISGKVNLLAEPIPGINVDFKITNIQLKPFIPVSSLVNLDIHSGTVNGHGHVEYSPWTKMVRVAKLEMESPHIDYVNKPPTEKSKQSPNPDSLLEEGEEKSKEPLKVVMESASIENGAFGYINQTTDPPYKVFANHVDFRVSGFETPKVTQKSDFGLSAKFMGKGKMNIEGVFQPEVKNPDFDVKMKIEKTDMTALNDVFKAHGGLDVKSGKFSLFSELNVHEGRVKGYIKPFFDKPEIYDLSQDETDNIFQQLYEGIVGTVSSILENVPRDQVATKTEITGNLKNIEVGTWELIWNLLRNAFIDAMAPAFESLKEIGKEP